MFWLLFKSTPYFPLYTKSLLRPPDCYSVELINAHKSLLMYIVYTHTYTHTHTHMDTPTPTHTHMHTGGWTLCQIHPGKQFVELHVPHTHPPTHTHAHITHTHTYTHHTGDWKLNQIHPRKQFVEFHVTHAHLPTKCTYTHTHTHAHTIVHAVFRSSWPGICGRLYTMMMSAK